MRLSGLLLLPLGGFLGLQVAALTFDEVNAQIASFVSTQNQTLDTRGADAFLSKCSLACAFLDFAASKWTSFPADKIYQFEESRYWSQQQASTKPFCRFSPSTSLDVSLAILTLRVTQCQYAVKSGGHAAFAGGSNIAGGVTIDLINLNQIVVSADKKQTSIGPGNRWFDVYSELQPLGLSVVGGRVSDIGVGGLTLGGGISFFSGRYGWASDNVNNYEVVFADGSINNVNPSTYPDLFFALRGGGNNFGIVTRFDLVTFAQGNLWAGSNTYFFDSQPALNKAYENFAINAPQDTYAAVILAYAYAQVIDTWVISGSYQYSKPVVNPPILQNFTKIPVFASTNRITNLTALTVEFNNTNPGGFRQTYWTLTHKNSASLMTDIVAIFQSEINAVKDAANIVPAIAYMPTTTAITSHFSQNGGNALGVSPADGPLSIINLSISWSNPADDARILQASRNFINRANATAYAQNLGHPFLYQNYAALEQNVFPSYGAVNYAKLKAVSKKYDPAGAFSSKLEPGYFKVF